MAVLAMAPPIIEEMRPNFSKSFTLNGPIHKIRYLYLILIAFTLCMKMPVFFLLCQLCFSARFHIFAAAVIIAVATYTSDSEIKPAFLFCVFFFGLICHRFTKNIYIRHFIIVVTVYAMAFVNFKAEHGFRLVNAPIFL